MVAFFFFFHPSVSSKFSPSWYSTQYHFFSDRKGETLNKLAGKIIALMAPFDTFLVCTILDWTDLTVYKWFIRETSFAFDLVYSYAINTR